MSALPETAGRDDVDVTLQVAPQGTHVFQLYFGALAPAAAGPPDALVPAGELLACTGRVGSPSGRYSRRMSGSTSIVGRWRITEMDNWDQEAVDLVQPGFIEFDDDGLGSLGFIVVMGELDCRDADRDGRPGVEFSWQGSDEGDDVSGRGWAALNPDGTLEGHVYFHLGDDSAFRAERFSGIVQ